MTNAEANKALFAQKLNCHTKLRGSHANEYDIYLACADDGKGGDITRGGAPLKTFDEWLGN